MKKVNHPQSQRFKEAAKLVDSNKFYSLAEAIELAKKTSTVKFDAGVEVHLRLGINPKKGDQQVRSGVALPHGTGKSVRVGVVAIDSGAQKTAKEAGADVVGEKDLIDQIKAGQINFDVLVATPDAMKLLASAAKILGPKGLMPNPKDGTVSANPAEAVTILKKGKVNYKNDDSANLHVMIGKVSFDADKLAENFQALIDSVKKAKPAAVKGAYIKSVSLATSMGPGLKLNIGNI